LGRNKEIDIGMANRGYDSFSIIHINAYLDNKALHRTAIPLLSTAAAPLGINLEQHFVGKVNEMVSIHGCFHLNKRRK
jgi:hypothetical protein